MRKGALVVAQGGGPTAVINQSLVGVVLAARTCKDITAVFGARHGVRGIVDRDLVNLGRVSPSSLGRVAATPGAALGTTRDKPDSAYCEDMLNVLRAGNVSNIIYIGGNDSSDTLRILSNKAKSVHYPLRCIHVPKTIDNDLVKNDHTPGFGSAARYVASVFAGIDCDNRALPGVYIGVVMGRHAGFLTAASAALRQKDDEGPHLVYCPEKAFTIDSFLTDIRAVVKQHGRCVVAVSEGICDPAGRPVATTLSEKIEQDAHGNVQLSGSGLLGDMLAQTVRTKLGIKRVRADTLGYVQRSFAACISPVDALEARRAGTQALRLAIRYKRNGSVTINRAQAIGKPYKAVYGLAPLNAVAGKTRLMPAPFINKAGNGVTPHFLSYLKPLIGPHMPKKGELTAQPVHIPGPS